MMKKTLILTIALSIAACGKDKEASDQGGGSATATKDLHTAVNAKIPAPGKELVTFETRTIKERKLTATIAAPKGWEPKMEGFEGTLEPPTKEGQKKFDRELGFMTQFAVSSTCDGACEKKDWKSIIEKKVSEKEGFPASAKDSVKVEELPNNGHILYGSWGSKAAVKAYWYKPDAKRYWTCGATLDHSTLAKALPAFVEACKTVKFNKQD